VRLTTALHDDDGEERAWRQNISRLSAQRSHIDGDRQLVAARPSRRAGRTAGGVAGGEAWP